LLVVIIVLVALSTGQGADYPVHRQILYQHDLLTENVDEFANVNGTGGRFVEDRGWQATGIDDRMEVECLNDLPPEFTIQVDVTNFTMDMLKNDWVPLSVWSDPGGHFWSVHQTSSSYAFFKTEPDYLQDNSLFWVIWGSPFAYSSLPDEQWEAYTSKYYPFAQQSYNDSQEVYRFKIVWTQETVYMVINGYSYPLDLSGPYGPVEALNTILIGDDRTDLYHSLPGPIFSNLVISVPESDARFTNVSRSTLFDPDTLMGGQGVSVADFDRNGLEDLLISNCNLVMPQNDLVYLQQQDGTFVETASSWGVVNTQCSRGTVTGDWNGDGYPDAFQAVTGGYNRLYISKEGRSLVEEGGGRGIVDQDTDTKTVLVLDMENDGDEDLVAINNMDPHEWYINDGTGVFQKTSVGADGPHGTSANPVVGAVAGDVTGDGYSDVLIVRRNLPCMLWVNNGSGQFSDQAAARGIDAVGKYNTPTLFDYDNDGDLDVFIATAYADNDPEPHVSVFENQGDGQFTDRTTTIGIRGDAFGLYAGDVNNDGFQDIYLLKSNRKDATTAAALYLNTGQGGFELEPGSGLEMVYADGRGGAFWDYNRDGYLDFVGIAYGGSYNSDAQQYGRNMLFRNEGRTFDAHYVSIDVVDDADRPAAVGTRVWVYTQGGMDNPSQLLGYRELTTAMGYKSSTSRIQHFGLGGETACDIKIRFVNGQEERFESVSADQFVTLGKQPPKPVLLEPISATSFSGAAGSYLSDSLVVRVRDENDDPLPGHPVTFQVVDGEGGLGPDAVAQFERLTDNQGRASVRWKLGQSAGQQERVRALSDYRDTPLQGSPIDFTAQVETGQDTILNTISETELEGAHSTLLPDSIRVRVDDGFGNPHPDVTVRFEVLTGGGQVNRASEAFVQTDSNGEAAAAWLLGSDTGIRSHSVRVSLSSSPDQSALFYASALFGPPHEIRWVGGQGQTGRAGETLDQAFEVQLLDAEGLACKGYPIVFESLSPGGLFGEDSIKTVLTNADGIASVSYTPGGSIGTTVPVISASSTEIGGNSILTATVTPGFPFKLIKKSGDKQSTRVSSLFEHPLVVRVLDTFDNPIANHPVSVSVPSGFEIEAGDTLQTTDSEGAVSVQLTASDTPGRYDCVFNSGFQEQPLVGSPVRFSLQVTALPSRLVMVSGDSVVGMVRQPAPQQLTVHVLDALGGAVQNHPVTFMVRNGGGSFGGKLDVTVMTNEEGLARATPLLGSVSGWWNHVFEAQTFDNQGAPLEGSPIRFHLSARSSSGAFLERLSGHDQQAQAGSVLPNPLVVRVLNAQNQPVAGQSVTFKVTEGSGLLGSNSQTELGLPTDADGIAKVSYRLGSEVGYDNHIVEAFANNGLEPLEGSPVRFVSSAPYGIIDPDRSIVSATDSVCANGEDSSLVSIQLFDAHDNPIPNEQVTLIASGEGNIITQPQSPTDVNGHTWASIRSTRAGTKTVTVRVDRPGITLSDEQDVTFIAGPPHSLSIISGNRQVGVINNRLEDPLQVRVTDRNGNPVSDWPVRFTPRIGSGSILQSQPVLTDSDGRVSVIWLLGSSVSTQYVDVSTQDLTEQKRFSAQVSVPGELVIRQVKGNDQIAAPGTMFPDSLTIRVQTVSGTPLSSVPVQFSLQRGDARLSTRETTTNLHGLAGIELVAGERLGAVDVEARLNDQQSVLFTCAIANSLPATLEHLYGSGLSGTVDQVVSSLAVRVLDDDQSPVANVPIRFTSLTTGGEILGDQPVKTNNLGQAFVQVKLGTRSGHYRYQAENDILDGSPVRFTIQANPDVPVNMTIVGGNKQSGLPLQTLADSLQVRITDQYDNPVPNQTVTFSVVSGQGTVVQNSETTNDGGVASALWTLGPEGEQHIRVTCDALDDTDLLFRADLNANNPPLVQVVEDTVVSVGEQLVFQVVASDPEGQPVSVAVEALPAGASFDAEETRLFYWTPAPDQLGDVEITFTASDPNGGVTTRTVHIQVFEQNFPPEIVSVVPDSQSWTFTYGQEWTFNISARDSDQDSLTYRWYVNDIFVHDTEPRLNITTNETLPPVLNIRVLVSDGWHEVEHSWTLTLGDPVTNVELTSMEAQRQGRDLTVEWQAPPDPQVSGYYLYGATRKTEPYSRLYEWIDVRPDGSYRVHFKAEGVRYIQLHAILRSGDPQIFPEVAVTEELPSNSGLIRNYPNPFNPGTRIEYHLEEHDQIDITIYNVSGQRIRTLVNGPAKAGYYHIYWNGLSQKGHRAPSGIYYCVLRGQHLFDTIKLLLIR
jgi:hypothetical protein